MSLTLKELMKAGVNPNKVKIKGETPAVTKIEEEKTQSTPVTDKITELLRQSVENDKTLLYMIQTNEEEIKKLKKRNGTIIIGALLIWITSIIMLLP